MHCGLCLEACPTYVVTGDENDGPRGRIYLMRAVAEERLAPASPAFDRHINRCLGCRACEAACPAGVEYGHLLEAARAELSRAKERRGFAHYALRFLLRHVWPHPARLRVAFAGARLVRASGLARLLLKLKIARLLSPRAELAVALLESSVPAKLDEGGGGRADSARADFTPGGLKEAGDAHEGDGDHALAGDGVRETGGGNEAAAGVEGPAARALLFKGCVTEGLFSRVNRATARVLEVNGCAIAAPPGQVCCGALHAHAGDLVSARALARRNVAAFEDAGGAEVVTNAGGCGAMLLTYAELLAGDETFAERARAFSRRVRDVSQQLAATGVRRGAPAGQTIVTYDASCHLLHGQRAEAEPLAVLLAVPELEFLPLAESDRCCGGAGVYNLLEPDLSARVLAEKLAHLKDTGAHIVATGNPGCHMQLGAGARLAGMKDVRVCHPVELLDESYRRAGLYEDGDGPA